MSIMIAQRRLADFAAVAVAVNIHHLLHGAETLAAHDIAQFVLSERNALAQNFLRLLLKFRHDSLEQLLTMFCTTAATGRGASALL
jgi:phage-related holin